MDTVEIKAAIEALLFAMGKAIPVKNIAAALELDVTYVQKVLEEMMIEYQGKERGVQLIELEDSYQLCTKKEMYEYLIRLTHQPKKQVLTDIALETLSIIAYKQPVTRAEIEKIRGVNSDHAINRLVEYNLVCEAGRLDAPGKPILFATTEQFLRAFGVKSSEDLPILAPEMVEEFKNEAEEEVNLGIEEDS